MIVLYCWFIFQPPKCSNTKRVRRDDQTIKDGIPATIEVYSGLHVDEGSDSGNPEQMDQVARNVCVLINDCFKKKKNNKHG